MSFNIRGYINHIPKEFVTKFFEVHNKDFDNETLLIFKLDEVNKQTFIEELFEEFEENLIEVNLNDWLYLISYDISENYGKEQCIFNAKFSNYDINIKFSEYTHSDIKQYVLDGIFYRSGLIHEVD